MGLFSYFRKQNSSATAARDRLSVILATERSSRSSDGASFLPQMREEILAVIAKYVKIDRSEVEITVGRDGGTDVVEINIPLH